MSAVVIETTDLCRDYGSFRALDKASLSIERDRIVALLGPNGAGKTTFLHLVMGMLEPTEGRSTVLGAGSRTLPGETVARIGYMGDGDEPPTWVTAEKLIAMQKESSAHFDDDFMGKFLADRQLPLKKTFGSMSKGQKKWLRAGLVLASRSRILILDEPAEGLDPSARHELYNHLREYVTESGATAVVATHIGEPAAREFEHSHYRSRTTSIQRPPWSLTISAGVSFSTRQRQAQRQPQSQNQRPTNNEQRTTNNQRPK